MGSITIFGVIKYVLNVKLFTIYYQKNERSNTQVSIQEQVSSKDAFKKGNDVKKVSCFQKAV